MKAICVYCGSSDRVNEIYLAAARQMGITLAVRGIDLVYGAGRTGMMGAVADGVLEAGGSVIGVLPGIFNTPQLAHPQLTRLELVEDMHQRKARMVELAEAFIALPGGFGTLEELFEVLTWAQIGLHSKPIGLLNTRGYFDPLLHLVEHARLEGFIYAEHRALFTQSEDPEALLSALAQFETPQGLESWLNREG
jgi:uncharacterized protein (TIGR00730 family)